MGVEPLGDFALDAVECTAADEQDVFCVNRNHPLFRVFAPTLRRHVDHGAFEEFEQALLHPLAAYIACDGGIVAFAGDLSISSMNTMPRSAFATS